jgi:hypothetical protein
MCEGRRQMYPILDAIGHRCALVLTAALLLSPLISEVLIGDAHDAAFAQAPAPAETEAFEAAKALGSVEAWDAFLTHYPTGFHADLARAYVKQLATKAPPTSVPQQAKGPEQAAYEQTCEGQETLRSRESQEPAKLRFINESGATLVLQWIDFKGALKEYATLPAGADITQETFITHPWIVAYQEGSCRQIFLPAPGVSVARLRPQSELPNMAAPSAKQETKSKRSDDDDPPLKCGKNYKKVKGECVLLQNCGANAYRSPEGDCYCNKNYQMQNGKCVGKQPKAVACTRHEVYSSSMGQCIPKAAMCSKSEVYSSSMAQCIPKSLGQ